MSDGRSDLLKLSSPFPDGFIKRNPNGFGDYVPHHVVTQALLLVLSDDDGRLRHPYKWEITEVHRGYVPPQTRKKKGGEEYTLPELHDAIVGATGTLTVTIDGQQVSVDGAGDCEDPQNWPHDGARLKDAESDAFKRAAMRFGLGLHLWSQDLYFLFQKLTERHQPEQQAAA